jgi:hypothetical protein
MKSLRVFLVLVACGMILTSQIAAQEKGKSSSKKEESSKEPSTKEVYTGTIINTSGRSVSTGFNLTLTGRTNDEEALRLLQILATEGQDGLMKATRKNDLGYIAATGQTRRDLLVVREAVIEGKRRIIAAFERWVGFYEARGGYRSMDHPFAIIEIFFDEKGKGSGTFIGLAQVKLERDKKTEQLRLELESFGSFPAKVMGVMRRN